MKIVVVGAGTVGSSVAQSLAGDGQDVVVVERDPVAAERIGSDQDVSVVQGNGARPGVLEQAGVVAGGDVDYLIACTGRDEVNLMACWLAKRAGVRRVLSRVRDLEFTDTPAWARELGIDVMTSPERSLSREIVTLLTVNAAVHSSELSDRRAGSYAFWVEPSSPLCGLSLRELGQLHPDLGAVMVYVERDGQGFVPAGDWVAQQGDLCFFVALQSQVLTLQKLFHAEQRRGLSRVVILGGGKLGVHLALRLERDFPRLEVALIDLDLAKCRRLASEFSRVQVICGDGLDLKLMSGLALDEADGVVLATDNDEVNVVAATLAKALGCPKTIAVVRKAVYRYLQKDLPALVLLNPNDTLASVLLRHVRYPQSAGVLTLIDRIGAEMLEFVLPDHSLAAGQRIMDLKLPKGVLIAMISRGGTVVVPRGPDRLQGGDVISLFATRDLMARATRLLGVTL